MSSSDTQQKIKRVANFVLTNYRHHKSFVTGALILGAGIYFIEKGSVPETSFSTLREGTASIAGADNSELSSFPVVIPTVKWGFALDTFQVEETAIKPGQAISEILSRQTKDYSIVTKMLEQAKGLLKNSDWEAGRKYTILAKDKNAGTDYLIYEPDALRYFIFNFKGDQVGVTEIKRDIVIKEREVAGVVKGTLWETMIAHGLPFDIADEMGDALKYSIDFHHTAEGDEFRVIYEEKLVDGKPVGIGKMKVASYRKKGDEEKEHLALWWDSENIKGYVNKDGKPLKGSGFLRSPLKFSRISSHFSKARLYPVLGTVRPHFGTDYAAPHGTPILAVADGSVMEARGGRGTGNFVRLKHNGTFQTQYLHMSRFAKGIRPGTKVKQGQVIGYVGSTGWATGPHVCFRLYKNGTPVNHLKEKLPVLTTLSQAQLNQFKKERDELLSRINKIPFLTPEQMAANKELNNQKVKP